MTALAKIPAPFFPNTLQWMALTATEGVGPTRGRGTFAEQFGGVAGIFRASLTELERAGMHAASAQSIFTDTPPDLAQQEMVRVSEFKLDVNCPHDLHYPAPLKPIHDPPLVLYGGFACSRTVEVLSQPAIVVVDARHPIPYGVGMAERLACDVSIRG